VVALLDVVNKRIGSWEDAAAPRNEIKIWMMEPFVTRPQHFLDSLPKEKAENSKRTD
jgi:hypothetical protein